MRQGPISIGVASYLQFSQHNNILGVFRLREAYARVDLSMGTKEFVGVMGRLVDAGFCEYDQESGWVWLHEFVTWQTFGPNRPEPPAPDKRPDNRIAAVQRAYLSLPVDCPFLAQFYEENRHVFALPNHPGAPTGADVMYSEGASKGLRRPSQGPRKGLRRGSQGACSDPVPVPPSYLGSESDLLIERSAPHDGALLALEDADILASAATEGAVEDQGTKKTSPHVWATTVLGLYTDICTPVLPRSLGLTDKTRRYLRARQRANPAYAYWRSVFERAMTSQFLTGQAQPTNGHAHAFRADFVWMIRNDDHAQGILEGKWGCGEQPASRGKVVQMPQSADSRDRLMHRLAEQARDLNLPISHLVFEQTEDEKREEQATHHASHGQPSTKVSAAS